MNHLRTPLLIAAGLTLTACAGFELDRVSHVPPPGSPFDTALYVGYLELSHDEFFEGDYKDSDFFARRATQTGSGGGVAPQEVWERRIPEHMIAELESARRQLADVLRGSASRKAPKAAARAQVMFDCWMQEQEENFQDDDIAACRNRFFAALEEAQRAIAPPLQATEPVEPVQEEPMPSPRPEPVRVVILFDFDSTQVRSSEEAKIREIIAAIRNRRRARVRLSGHTDRAAIAAYNDRLSERRAEAVANVLSRFAIDDASVSLRYFGESLPAVATADGVREPRNRRVEVIVE